ncbi:hypothetical protein TrRE_jg2072 [Triparma retinervis]|uniref:Uncharacterized protein n=1 Tax=Triparma retinervis TaxID=2557542 RepID=A0A9W7L116_9STRA|nr:hypothetical protein TrRE_jg2072 [Triparma retinervis]
MCSLPVSDTIFAIGASGDSSVGFFDFVSKKICQRLNVGHRHHHRPSVMGGGSHVKDSGHGSVTDLVSVEPYVPSSTSSQSSSFDASVRSQLLVVYDTGYAFLYSLEVVGNIIPPNSSPVNRIDGLEKGSPMVGYCAVRNLVFATLSEKNKSRDNPTPKQLKIYEVSPTADPSTILLGTNHGIMALAAPFSDPSYPATASLSSSSFFHINEKGLITLREGLDSTDKVVLQVRLRASDIGAIHTETISVSDFAWIGFNDYFAVSELDKSKSKSKSDSSQTASSKRRSIFHSSKSKNDENEERKIHHEHSKVLLKFISESNNAVTDLGEIETRGVASRMYGGPTLNVATKMQNSQFYSFIKNKGGGEPTLKAVGPALPAPSAIVWKIIGVVGTNLVLWNSLEMSTFHVKLDNPLLKSALLAAAGETARSARVLEGCKGK